MSNIKEKSAVGAATPATEKDINISSENIISSAVEKVKTKINSKDRYAKVIVEPVSEALQDFCRQEEEFARAVLDGGSIEDCISAIVKKISGKQAVSDLEVYQVAAEYYFPGAVVEFRMQIHMSKYELQEPASDLEQQQSIDLSLDSLLDW